jgi:uncharacterized membrane protein YdcZ (DUF606 family)
MRSGSGNPADLGTRVYQACQSQVAVNPALPAQVPTVQCACLANFGSGTPYTLALATLPTSEPGSTKPASNSQLCHSRVFTVTAGTLVNSLVLENALAPQNGLLIHRAVHRQRHPLQQHRLASPPA